MAAFSARCQISRHKFGKRGQRGGISHKRFPALLELIRRTERIAAPVSQRL